MVSDADSCTLGPEFESRIRHECLKCIVLARHGGTLNVRRAASPLECLMEGEERAANRSVCSLHPSTNQGAASKLSPKPKLQTTFLPSRRTKATPPESHRSTNHRHATQQNVQTPLSPCPTSQIILTWD
ncbi:hypothetical protein TNCV_4990381 [Trichonephila clavipes]|uniref:Uncharacterized protein n=1 Tax=Trichonephila clavipes TaxID=2585209 RepID=A0A8X6WB03_TRICX|nr:hypothetical protein TNCV_4990381 [Trichonephila clavipes]